MPAFWDHAIVAAITILLPLHDLLIWYPRLLRAAPERAARARRRTYLESMAIEWGLLFLTVGWWTRAERSWDDLGLGLSFGWGFWIAAALTIGVVIYSLRLRAALEEGDEETEEAVRNQLGHLRALLPHTRSELAHFGALSVTAGICEELLYRGFLIWYLALLVPTPIAVLAGALLFGAAHAYQGSRGVLQTGVVGLGFVLLYLLSGSLWIPMLLHAFIDFNTGAMAYGLLRRQGAAG
jgi:membrane protease YdiL (CAAX protease family)